MTRAAAPAAPGKHRNAAAAPPRIRLMIVDDSPVARAVLTRMVGAQPDFEVVGEAAGAGEALALLDRKRVDVILLDLEMPGTHGIDALPELLKRGRGARILVVSSTCDEGAQAAVEALALGAADTLPKPGSGQFAGRFSAILADRLRRLGRADAGIAKKVAAPRPAVELEPHKLGCVAVGASTGGLHALTCFLGGLPPMIGAPILVTQHLPSVFVPFFARQIQAASGRTTKVAHDGLVLQPEEIVLAPGEAHILVEQDGSRVRVRLDSTLVPGGCMPSVDVMLGSVARLYGRSAVGIVLSGMGRDGLEGARRIVERGGAVLVQDRDSAAVWGMPRAVAEAGLAAAVLPPGELARRIAIRTEGAAA